jgi:hypothetical protein
MATPSFAAQAAAAGGYPAFRFNKREQKLLASVKAYLDAGLSSAQIADGAITLAKLATGVAPSHVVKAAGTKTTVGGSASQTITVAGALSTDIVCVTLKTVGATPRTILTATAAAGQINVVMSGDPSTDHVLQYALLRAAA